MSLLMDPLIKQCSEGMDGNGSVSVAASEWKLSSDMYVYVEVPQLYGVFRPLNDACNVRDGSGQIDCIANRYSPVSVEGVGPYSIKPRGIVRQCIWSKESASME